MALKDVPIRFHVATFTCQYSIRFYQAYTTGEWIQNSCNAFGKSVSVWFSFREMHYGDENDTQYTVHLVRLVPPTGRIEYCKRLQRINDYGHSF